MDDQVTLTDDLRTLVIGPPGGWAPDLSPNQRRTILAVADRIDALEAAVDLARTEELHQRIAELEAEVTSLNALLHRVVGRRP